jgi:hypothetical protein
MTQFLFWEEHYRSDGLWRRRFGGDPLVAMRSE